jgi:hypothetical protein
MPQRRLGRTVQDTRELVANGDLPLVPGTTSMVYPADVAAITQKVVNRPIRRPPGLDGYIDTAQAARRLGLTVRHVANMAAEEKLNAIFQSGRWWFDPIHIELVRRARAALRDRVVHVRPIAGVELPRRSVRARQRGTASAPGL